MSKSGQAYLAEMERRFMNGDFDNAVDPYHYDIALEALRRIADEQGRGGAYSCAVACKALTIIGGLAEPGPAVDPETIPNHTYASEREMRERLETTTTSERNPWMMDVKNNTRKES